jgi:hypothetical protein
MSSELHSNFDLEKPELDKWLRDTVQVGMRCRSGIRHDMDWAAHGLRQREGMYL